MLKNEILGKLKDGLIVSCQAETPEPLAFPEMLVAMARAALLGGAVAIRANLPQNVLAISKTLDVPVIGLFKKIYAGSDVYITPTLDEAKALLKTGCEIIALDATSRPRPLQQNLQDIVKFLKSNSDCLLMADISTLQEGLLAVEMGFDMISTTLSGYTEQTRHKALNEKPDFELLAVLVREIRSEAAVIAEGRIWTPTEAVQAFKTGAFAVVVGSAITRPHLIAGRFNQAIRNFHSAV